MRADDRERGIAVMGSSMDALIQAYYLQRFGFEADVYLEDLDFPQLISDELVSTWLGLYSSPNMARIARQGIAELRDIALDLGSTAAITTSGTMIFERRPEHVPALERFTDSCRAKGLLVKFSTHVAHLDVPPFTLAVARFDQDISVSPKRLATQLMKSIQQRGGRVFRGRSSNELNPVMGYHVVQINGDVLRYGTVVKCSEMPIPLPGGARDTLLAVKGRYLSFERATQLVDTGKPSAANPLVSAIIDPIRGFFAKDLNRRQDPWPGIESRDPNGILLGPHLDIFHSIAGAREFAEKVQACTHLGRIQERELAYQSQNIPWII